jgi:hypothetical protein
MNWILKTLHFIFLADEDQGDSRWYYHDKRASQQTIEKIG